MAGDGDSRSPLPSFISPGLLLIIGSLVAYFTFEPALESRRPSLPPGQDVPPPPSPQRLYALHSRLWDDPLAAAYRDYAGQKPPAVPATWWQAFGSKAIEFDQARLDVQHYFRTTADLFLKENKSGSFLCLPVLIRGEPYEDDAEERKRTTYAVLSALAMCGYELAYPDRLSYVKLPVLVEMHDVDESASIEMLVPVKVFRRAEVMGLPPSNPQGPDGVLVLWINEGQLGDRPLAVICQVLDGIYGKFPRREQIDIGILGPSNSGTLLAMAKEAANWKKWKAPKRFSASPYQKASKYFADWKSAVLYSGRATISADVIADAGAGHRKDISKAVLEEFIKDGAKACGLKIIWTTGSDDQLVRSLAHELFLRGAWPLEGDPAHAPEAPPSKRAGHMVLIAERDTAYGSGIRAIFKQSFPQLAPSEHDESPEDNLLHIYTYLRGIDGKIPGEENERDDANDQRTGSRSSENDPSRSHNLERVSANGRSQVDYLRRLEGELIQLDQRVRDQGGDGIKAIGVVGTDIYDKLLILRSLHKHFPETCFFSTDLDAELSSTAEYPHTRNLLVASHFGLSLHPALQRTVPPFRSGYQTATFFSALHALEDLSITRNLPEGSGSDPWGRKGGLLAQDSSRRLQPLVFEIARSGPYQLTIPAEASPVSARIHPPGPRRSHWLNNRFHLVVTILALALLFLAYKTLLPLKGNSPAALFPVWPPTNWTLKRAVPLGLLAAFAAIACMLLSVAAHEHMRPDGEPFVLFEGISIWPATIIRFLAVALSVAFLLKGYRDTASVFREKLDFCCLDSTTPPGATGSCMRVYENYKSFAASWLSLAYPLLPTLLFIAFGNCLVSVMEAPSFPYRGEVAFVWGRCMLGLAIGSIIYLTLFVVLHLTWCSQFIKDLAHCLPDWSSKRLDELRKQRIAAGMEQQRAPASGEQTAGNDDDDLRELLTIEVIARLTRVVGRMVKYPILAMLLIIVSRHSIFGNLNLTLSLIIIWGIMFAILFFATSRLRRAANDVRSKALARLRSRRTQALYATATSDTRIKLLDQYIAEIKQESGGAFQHWLQDPFLNAIALLLGGAGGIQLVGYLLSYF